MVTITTEPIRPAAPVPPVSNTQDSLEADFADGTPDFESPRTGLMSTAQAMGQRAIQAVSGRFHPIPLTPQNDEVLQPATSRLGLWYADKIDRIQGELAQASPRFHKVARFALYATLASSTLLAGRQVWPVNQQSAHPAAAAQATETSANLLHSQLASLGSQPKVAGPQAEQSEVTPDNILSFIEGFENWSPQLYNDPAGHTTIGWGHLVHLGSINGSEPTVFKQGITPDEGAELLSQDIAASQAAVRRLVAVPLSQTQFDALVSFTYNVGQNALQQSTLLKLLNEGDYSAVPWHLQQYVYSGGKLLPGLINRRAAEAYLWTYGDYSPSPVQQ